jgi:hypothetical protein
MEVCWLNIDRDDICSAAITDLGGQFLCTALFAESRPCKTPVR